MSKPSPKYYLWIDLETTGLDPVLDPPLEIACIITTPDLVEVDPAKRFHAFMPMDGWAKVRLDESEFVTNMHLENGLLKEIKASTPMQYDAVEDALIETLASLEDDPWPVCIAGTGVAAFDMGVLQAWLPRLHGILDYRTIDVGHMRRFLRYSVGMPAEDMPPEADSEHRARGDVLNALDQAQAFKEMMEKLVNIQHLFPLDSLHEEPQ